MNGHILTIDNGSYGAGFIGTCECSDPDFLDDSWVGVVNFFGYSKADIIDQHHDHLIKEGVSV